MDFISVCELGRQSANSVSASVLATVLRELVARYQQSRRAKLQLFETQIRCNDTLEICRRKLGKLGEDEGFESDDDARSTTSSCCLVDDHVFKVRKDIEVIDRSSPNSGSADSANSSGSSDTDDVDIRTPSPVGRPTIETYNIADVIFCHTEPRFVNTIAWVIKRNTSYFDTTSRLGKTGVENSSENCLDVIVVKCKTTSDFEKVCSNYREFSRRTKLDQYKSINRKKPIVLSTLTDTKDVKVSLSDMKVGTSSLLKASELSILNPKIISKFKSDLKNSVSLNSLLKSDSPVYEIKANDDTMKKSNSLSNISPNQFNLLHRTDLDGMTHIEVSKSWNKSKIQKEIEGVILTDVESCARRDMVRQRQNPTVVSEARVWRQDSSVDPSAPPLRPERRKFARKKVNSPPDQPQATYTNLPILTDQKSKSKFYLPIQDGDKSNGQYGRLKPWADNEMTLGSWKTVTAEAERLSLRSQDRTLDRRRARSVGRTGRKIPMAYRYIDITQNTVDHNNQNSNDVGRLRRNSFDDMVHHKSSLKSVIKSNKKVPNKFVEPKKVTFSAYATVQVVD